MCENVHKKYVSRPEVGSKTGRPKFGSKAGVIVLCANNLMKVQLNI